MKNEYLKKENVTDFTYVKLSNKRILWVNDNSLEWSDDDDPEWRIDNLTSVGFKEITMNEFDENLKKVVAKVNKLVSL